MKWFEDSQEKGGSHHGSKKKAGSNDGSKKKKGGSQKKVGEKASGSGKDKIPDNNVSK